MRLTWGSQTPCLSASCRQNDSESVACRALEVFSATRAVLYNPVMLVSILERLERGNKRDVA
jgi:hypothetical protein